MPWQRGEASLEFEVSRIQSWIETADPELNGRNGADGVIREWHDFNAQRKAFESFMRWTMEALVLLAGVPAVLVALSALGLIHLR
jgi:hypothetical protein